MGDLLPPNQVQALSDNFRKANRLRAKHSHELQVPKILFRDTAGISQTIELWQMMLDNFRFHKTVISLK